MTYADRDELRKIVANAGGVGPAFSLGRLYPTDMPDDEMRFQAKDLLLTADQHPYFSRSGELVDPFETSVQMFLHAMDMDACPERNWGARWMMGESDERL